MLRSATLEVAAGTAAEFLPEARDGSIRAAARAPVVGHIACFRSTIGLIAAADCGIMTRTPHRRRPIPGADRLVRISRDLSAFSGNGPPSRPKAAHWRALRLAWLALAALLAACASTPPHYPSQTAQRFIGKPLFSLEMHWSIPIALRHAHAHGGRRAIWKFNQYNYDGCHVTVFTDRKDIIRKVTWTTGCGPEAGATKPHPSAAKAP